MAAAGSLQLCAGQEAGIEAAVHAMQSMMQEDDTEGVLLVDASNAFNSVNRLAMLHNVQLVCPTLGTIAINLYRTSSELHVGNSIVWSAEGTTQGDPLAMPLYALAISPLVSRLTDLSAAKHIWYADDSGAVGALEALHQWWGVLIQEGPAYGYFPNPSKTWLVLKPEHLPEATTIFQDTGVNLTCDGRPYLGTPLGSSVYSADFTSSKVASWTAELALLADAAAQQPHAAVSAFLHGLRHRWSYYLRTTECLPEHLTAMDNAISNTFVTAVTGQAVISDHHRLLLSAPAKLGGLGISLPSRLAPHQRMASQNVTRQLVDLIMAQCQSYQVGNVPVKAAKKATQQAKARQDQAVVERAKASLSHAELRMLEATQDQSASTWLSCVPLEEHGFNLSKQAFQDAVAMRYGWPLDNLPDSCACGSPFSVAHGMSCLTGGYSVVRHNHVRDYLAAQLQTVCPAVDTEPLLSAIPDHPDEARLDVKVRGFWQGMQDAFFDVRVFYPCASSYLSKSLASTFRQHEQAKKTKYGDRVRNMEHGLFTPLVVSSVGGLGREATAFLKRLVALMANKTGASYSQLMGCLRCELGFCLVRDSLMMLRGSRRKFRFGIQPTDVVAAKARLPALQ